MSVFWKTTLPQNALVASWKQTRLSLVVAKCEPVVARKNSKPATKTAATVQAVQQFVVDSTSRQLGAFITMKVKAENETTKPITLHLAATLRGSSTDEIGFDLNRRSWEQPQIRQFILDMFRRSFVHGKVTQREMDDLTAAISQIGSSPKKQEGSLSQRLLTAFRIEPSQALVAQTPPSQAKTKAHLPKIGKAAVLHGRVLSSSRQFP